MKGLDEAKFAQNTAECQAYAKQRMDAASGAVAMAIFGAIIGAALAPRGYRSEMAGYGGVLGGLSGASAATDNQETITKRCLAGRGYSVLN
jgi:hypothetical protein